MDLVTPHLQFIYLTCNLILWYKLLEIMIVRLICIYS